MKYFREYPWGMQILLFLLMAFTFMSAVAAIFFSLFHKVTGYDMAQLQTISASSPTPLINAAIVVQAVGSLFVYVLPAWVFAYLAHPRPAEYIGLRKPGKPVQIVLAVTLMLGAMPVLALIAELISHIDFGAKVKASQAANDNTMSAFLKVPDAFSLIRALLVLAILPAFGEELFFRGVLMRLAKKRSSSMLIPILFTAAVFAYSHTNIYGYLSIFLAGVLLATIYNLTGSLWCSIVAHALFNGSQVVLAYMANDNPAIKKFMDSNSVSWYLVVAGAAVFGLSLYLLMKNRTPLPADWDNDFGANERPEFDFEKPE
ncbi:MAG: CPBP family intramembrane glutamic endopeptidase [Bacteroidota bacterium]